VSACLVLVFFFISNLAFIAIMNTCVKFNLTRFRFTTISVFINRFSCSQHGL
jgi:hypothetical protein